MFPDGNIGEGIDSGGQHERAGMLLFGNEVVANRQRFGPALADFSPRPGRSLSLRSEARRDSWAERRFEGVFRRWKVPPDRNAADGS